MRHWFSLGAIAMMAAGIFCAPAPAWAQKPVSPDWKGYVIDVRANGDVWFNSGTAGGVKLGDMFEVVEPSKSVKDPKGKTHVIPGSRKALLVVVETLKDISSCQVLEGGGVANGDEVRFVSSRSEQRKNGDSDFLSEGLVLSADPDQKTGIINIGKAQGLNKGDRLAVVRPEKIVDPATGAFVRIKHNLIGEIEIFSTEATVSDVKLTKNAAAIAKGDFVRRRTSAPSGIEARAVGFRKNEVTWKLQPEPEAEGFLVFRSATGKEDTWTQIAKITKRDAVSYTDEHSSSNPLADNTAYYYRVVVFNGFGVNSAPSETARATTQGPPPPPEGFQTQPGMIRSAPLSWTEHPNPSIAGYRIYRKKEKDREFTLIADLKNRRETSYHDRDGGSTTAPRLEDSTSYVYTISAYSPYGDEGPKSAPVTARTADPPAVPEGFEGKGMQARAVPLTWIMHKDENVQGYYIYRANQDEGPYQKVGEIKGRDKTSFTDGKGSGFFSTGEGLKDSQLYFYKVQAFNWVGATSAMTEAIAVMTKPAPLAPEKLSATGGRPKQVPLAWRPNPDVTIKLYEIFRSEKEGAPFKKIGETPAEKPHYVDEKLADGATYYYQVRAVDKDKLEGEFSPIVSAMTKKLPAKVMGIRWQKEGAKAVLQWARNPETDIREYIVYKKSFFGWAKAGVSRETFFILEDLKLGSDSSDYAVSAVDGDNLEGERSDPLSVLLR